MKTTLRHKNIWQLILMARKNELKKALAMITNWKLSDVKEFMAIHLVDEEERDEESTENENSTATILYTQRVGGWYKIKSLL